MNKTGFVVSN